MATDWCDTTIEEVADVFDGPHATPAKTTSGPVFLGITSLNKGRLDLAGSEHLSEEDFTKWTRRVTPRASDVVFSYETKLGEAAMIPDGLRCCLGRRMGLMRPRSNKLDARFLLYYYLGPEFQEIIRERTIHGSTVDRIALIEFPKFPIRIPPLPEQKAIAQILGTLDDKIELNRRMNATLEAMARALFQSWFVDAVPGDGSLPEGWEMSTIGMEAKVVGGSTPSTKSPEFWESGEFHWVTPKDFSSLQSKVLIGSSRKVTKAGLDQISSGLLPENTVLLSSRAPVGYLALTKIQTAINQGFIAMICHGRLPPEYVMLWADSIMDQIKQAASGTTFAEISKATFRPFPILVPSAVRLNQFTDIVRAFYERIAANERQSASLAEIRDTLLPRLLSGELRTEEVADVG